MTTTPCSDCEINEFDLADLVRVSALFTAGNNPADPTDISLEFVRPDGSHQLFHYGIGATIVRSDTGSFYSLKFVDQYGEWFYRYAGSGSVTSAASRKFMVRKPEYI